MKEQKYYVIFPVAILLILSFNRVSFSQQYDISILYKGDADFYAEGINNSGEVVGSYYDTVGLHGYIYDGLVYNTIDFPGARSTHPYRINNLGWVAGSYEDADGRYHGFLYDYDANTFQSISYPGALHTDVYGVNDSGKTVGIVGSSAFIFDGINFEIINYPGAGRTFLFDINNSDIVLGQYWDSTFTHQYSFIYDGVDFKIISIPGIDTESGAYGLYGLNDKGQIVGRYTDSLGMHAFIVDGSQVTKIDLPPGTGDIATDINEKGEIIGWFRPEDASSIHGFIAKPRVNELWAHPVWPYTPGSYNGRSFFYDKDHLGEDEALPEGFAIRAIGPGIIREYRKATGYGELVVVIDHDLGEDYQFTNAYGNIVTTRYLTSIYGHLRSSQLRGGARLQLVTCPVSSKKPCPEASKVTRNTIIGYVNDDAHNGDGREHLHMGIRLSNYKTAKANDPKAPYRGYEGKTTFGKDFAAPSEVIEILRNTP